ncbi:MAG: hypothetical protein C0470_04100 [Verminephrobacter sp.]|nr:hypothetical protein [Verminephrobacter sp.]
MENCGPDLAHRLWSVPNTQDEEQGVERWSSKDSADAGNARGANQRGQPSAKHLQPKQTAPLLLSQIGL